MSSRKRLLNLGDFPTRTIIIICKVCTPAGPFGNVRVALSLWLRSTPAWSFGKGPMMPSLRLHLVSLIEGRRRTTFAPALYSSIPAHPEHRGFRPV